MDHPASPPSPPSIFSSIYAGLALISGAQNTTRQVPPPLTLQTKGYLTSAPKGDHVISPGLKVQRHAAIVCGYHSVFYTYQAGADELQVERLFAVRLPWTRKLRMSCRSAARSIGLGR